jgi:hypothetical protein
VRPCPIIEAEAWLAVRAVERDVHRDCAGTLVELRREKAVIVAISGHDEALVRASHPVQWGINLSSMRSRETSTGFDGLDM